jgi:ribonuclease E
MLDSEPSNRETETNEQTGPAATPAAATAPAPVTAPAAAPAVPAAVFQPPQVLFQAPSSDSGPGDRADADAEVSGRTSRSTTRTRGRAATSAADAADAESDESEAGRPAARTRTRSRAATSAADAADAESGESEAGRPAARTRTRSRAATPAAPAEVADAESGADADDGRPARTRTRGGRGRSRVRDTAPDDDLFSVAGAEAASAVAESADADSDRGVDDGADAESGAGDDSDEGTGSRRSRRRRNSRSSRTRRPGDTADDDPDGSTAEADGAGADGDGDGDDSDGSYADEGASGRRRRRKRRRPGSTDADVTSPDDPPDTVVHVRTPHNPNDDVRSIKGSTRLEAKKQRRREGRESGRRRPPIITESEFLARRESVERTMVVRQRGDRTQIAVLEDDVLVEHYVNRTSHQSYVGNVYLGKVQNVLPSMEAAFVDIGKGRNAVLYAGEVNFDASGLEGQPKRIESALKAGQSVIVQVTKDPVGHKGARLTSQVSLPGRYLVYVPGASMTGISRKLPENERTRLKSILKKVTPEHAGVIVRTAAEGAAETELDLDITRLAAQWETIEKKAKTASAPALLHGEPDLTVRVIRDVFNEDFAKLIVSGDEGWEIIDEYVRFVAPHLADRISRWDNDGDPADDVFAAYRIDEQLMKALERKVWLPSGGSLVIDRTEAMTVIDVNTGKFTGQGGNLEETVTRNNLEAAEEIVRQLRLRDVGGIVVIDFIDMVLESNRDLVLRRLTECLARDRTKHQVAEVTSLGLVQMTRKRVGAGLLEAFSTQCECCSGRGVILTLEAPAESAHRSSAGVAARRPIPTPPPQEGDGNGRGRGNGADPRPSNGRSGNRRSGGRPDNDWRAPAAAIAGTALDDTARDHAAVATTALDDAALDSRTHSESVPVLDAAPADTTSALDDAALNAEAVEDSGARGSTRNGGRRTRRPTNGGTAFAAAVQVEDSPAPAPAVTVATAAPETASEAAVFTPVAVGDAAPAEDSEPPVRRTRTRVGSAVARVTVVADPEPEALATEAAFPEAPAESSTASEAPIEASADLETPAEVADVPAFEAADAFTPPADAFTPPAEAFTPPAEPATEHAPDPEAATDPELAIDPQPVAEPELAVDPEAMAEPELAVDPEPVAEPELAVDPEPFTEPELAVEPDSATDSELAIEPDVALETFAAGLISTEPDAAGDPEAHAFDAEGAFTPPEAQAAQAEGEAPSFVVDGAGETSPLPHADAEGEAPADPQADAEGEEHHQPTAEAEGEAFPAPQPDAEGQA